MIYSILTRAGFQVASGTLLVPFQAHLNLIYNYEESVAVEHFLKNCFVLRKFRNNIIAITDGYMVYDRFFGQWLDSRF